MKNFSLFLFSVLISLNVFGARYTDMFVDLDTNSFGISNTFDIKVKLIKRSGKTHSLNPQEYDIRWKNVKVSGKFILGMERGIVRFDQKLVTENDRTTKITITYKDKFKVEYEIILPYVTGLVIHTSAIMANRETPLEYEVLFNNGKSAQPSSDIFSMNSVYSVTSSSLSFQNGILLFKAEDLFENDLVKLSLINRATNKVLAERDIFIDYPTTSEMNVSGRNGANGTDGKKGAKTSENGTNGTNGENGFSANNLKVLVKVKNRNNNKYIIMHCFSSNGKKATEIIKYVGEPIRIYANGGAGGNGGRGGDGAAGLIDTTKKINSPDGGNGGFGGNAGNGGDAGEIKLYCQQSDENLMNYFYIENREGIAGIPGAGGKGGKGDNTNAKPLGVLVKWRNGIDGKNGSIGQNGKGYPNSAPVILNEKDWNELLQNLNSKGF